VAFSLYPVLPSYGKPYLTVEEQLDLLVTRGMGMPENRDQAANWLRRIGYYRLSGYWYPFRERKDGVALETFRSGTNLNTLLIYTYSINAFAC